MASKKLPLDLRIAHETYDTTQENVELINQQAINMLLGETYSKLIFVAPFSNH